MRLAILVLLAMFLAGCEPGGPLGPACPEIPEEVRHIRIVEDVSTGVRIEVDREAIKAERLIVQNHACYDGDPTRRCVWIGVPPEKTCPACEVCESVEQPQ
jgi:hypothetical protein